MMQCTTLTTLPSTGSAFHSLSTAPHPVAILKVPLHLPLNFQSQAMAQFSLNWAPAPSGTSL